MKKFLKSVALIAALAFVFAACEQAAIGPAGEFPLGTASFNAVKGIKAPPTKWTQFSPSPFANVPVNMVRALATDGTFLVAAGSDGTNALATRYYDTTTGYWTKPVVLPGFTVNPGAAHYLNGFYLITGATTSSYGAYSPDGDKWTQTGLIDFGTKAGVYGYAERLYVVAGQNGQAAYTYDLGQDFDQIPSGPTGTGWSGTGPTAYINAGAYGDGVYVFGGGSGRLAWTTTILSGGTVVPWTQVTAPYNPFGADEFVNVIAYGGNKTFVAVGNNADNDGGIIAYSIDGGLTWVDVNLSVPSLDIGQNAGIYALTFGDGYFVAADNLGFTAYSADGITWTNAGNSDGFFGDNEYRVNGVVFYDAANAFVVAGQNNTDVEVIVSN